MCGVSFNPPPPPQEKAKNRKCVQSYDKVHMKSDHGSANLTVIEKCVGLRWRSNPSRSSSIRRSTAMTNEVKGVSRGAESQELSGLERCSPGPKAMNSIPVAI